MPAPLPELIALLPYFASAVFSLAVALFCWFSLQTPGARIFAVSALISAVAASLFVVELISPDLSSKIFWDSLQWIVALEGVPLLTFAFSFTGLRVRRPLLVYGLLAAPPLAYIAFVVTNSASPLAYPDPRLIPGQPFSELTYTFSPLVYLVAGYNFALVVATLIVLLRRFARASSPYRGQIGSVVVGTSIPVLGTILILAGVKIGGYRDSSPLWYALGYGVVAWGLLRWRLSSVAPVAHDVLFDTMTDLIYVTDNQNRLVDLNAAAERQLGRPAGEVIGQNVADIWPQWRALIDRLQDPDQMGRTIAFDDTQGPIIYDLRVTPLVSSTEGGDRVKVPSGRLIVARDVTLRRLTEQQEKEQRALAEALTGVSQALNSSLDLDEVLTLILEHVQTIIPCEHANINLIGADGMVRVAQTRGFDGPLMDELKSTALPVSTPSFHTMITTGKPYLVADARSDPGWVEPSREPDDLWLASYLGAPIVVDGETIGFINLDDTRANTFTQEHARRLQAFTALAAIAIKNARQYADIEARNAELDAFSHTVAHDLKNPLSTMLGFAYLARSSPNLTEQERDAHLQQIEIHGFKAAEIVESLLLLATLRDAELHIAPVETEMVVEAALHRLAATLSERHAKVDVAPGLPAVLGYAPWLEEVFANLLANAVKYTGRDNADPRVWISGKKVKGRVRIEVRDNGLGITPADQLRLFQPFARFHRGEGEGHGLGLSIVQRIIQRLGGEVGVDSAPGKGSTFWFSLNAPARKARNGSAPARKRTRNSARKQPSG